MELHPFYLLIVEDTAEEVILLKRMLKNHFADWKYKIVHDGKELMNFLSEQPVVSVILLDMHLPEKDGLTLLSEIRQMKEYAQVPVAGYSATASPATIDAFLSGGGNYFFQKSMDYEQFMYAFQQLPSLISNNDMTVFNLS